jgi:type IV pilus assembly protein PilQ
VVSFDAGVQSPAAAVPVLKAASEKILVERPAFHYDMSGPHGTAGRPTNTRKISAPRFALPGELTQPSVVLASFGGKSEPARPTPQQAAQQQSGNAAATVASSQASGSTSSAKYTGEPISVNLKDVDLKDFFRLIHEISGLNVVLDPAVKGSLTIVLDEVPWDQALDIVLQNNGLDKQLSGNVLRVATRDTLKKEAEGQRDLEKAQAEAVAPVTVTRVLSYGKAEKMKDTLKKFLSQRGDILSDDRSNQLIIRDIPSVIPVVDNLIRQLDRKSQQVEIEARVVSASRSFAQDIGVQLGFAGTVTGGRSIASGTSEVGTSPQPFSPVPIPGTSAASTSTLPFNVNLGASAPTSGLFLGHRSPNFAVDFFITAAEAKGVGKLLSKPRVITQNNEKATVKQGTKIPVQTTINNTISVQFIDAVLKLEVTPQITAEGTVFMDVLVENTQIDAGIPRVQGVPALNTQSAETKVLVADGGTVVIGGIIVTSQRVDITEVPLLGSLPIIGHLFKRNNIATTSNELLFFLTPRITPG